MVNSLHHSLHPLKTFLCRISNQPMNIPCTHYFHALINLNSGVETSLVNNRIAGPSGIQNSRGHKSASVNSSQRRAGGSAALWEEGWLLRRVKGEKVRTETSGCFASVAGHNSELFPIKMQEVWVHIHFLCHFLWLTVVKVTLKADWCHLQAYRGAFTDPQTIHISLGSMFSCACPMSISSRGHCAFLCVFSSSA